MTNLRSFLSNEKYTWTPFFGILERNIKKEFRFNEFIDIISTLTIAMRLNFELKKINISPTVHIQLVRHAEEFQNRYASGQLYGALYDDEAEITSILPFP